MRNMIVILVLLFASTIAFQNCSPTHTATLSSDGGECSGQSQCLGSLDELYPYTSKPKFFEDVQLINKEQVSGEWNYQFIASVVDIDNPGADIDVEIHILNADGDLVCPRATATVNRSTNHIEIAECKSAANLDLIIAQVKVDTGSGMEVIREIELNLAGL